MVGKLTPIQGCMIGIWLSTDFDIWNRLEGRKMSTTLYTLWEVGYCEILVEFAIESCLHVHILGKEEKLHGLRIREPRYWLTVTVIVKHQVTDRGLYGWSHFSTGIHWDNCRAGSSDEAQVLHGYTAKFWMLGINIAGRRYFRYVWYNPTNCIGDR